ncbi:MULTISPECIES: hypothetical protein [Agrobacterium tumefaciens complex]|uniref:hypothetical protein n=1 Tax=Agrobacterium tumefaciens complex TaxID=1183400 RepID=UPI0010BD489C|nr:MULTISPECIES: hypothetical protein [Agrobacterium tumefaciens complex]QCL88760.1 hypothetical protein CFBP6623_06170 [Agrobacterium tumefaciens]
MQTELLKEIERCLPKSGVGPHRFGILAAGNGRLIERLRSGGRVWPDTEEKVRDFIRKLDEEQRQQGADAA